MHNHFYHGALYHFGSLFVIDSSFMVLGSFSNHLLSGFHLVVVVELCLGHDVVTFSPGILVAEWIGKELQSSALGKVLLK